MGHGVRKSGSVWYSTKEGHIMINFAVGPVQTNETVCRIGAEQVPYFRTSEFSDLMLENELLITSFSRAPEGSRAVFLTGSGTAAMEAAVINTLHRNDRAIVVNGGSFGQRFTEILETYQIPFEEIRLNPGQSLTEEMLLPFEGKGFTALLVNLHETSTGVLYDAEMIGQFCEKNRLFLIVDAISSFLADEVDMTACHMQIMLTGSQKALACPPGVSILVLSPEAQRRIDQAEFRCYYLDLKRALKNQERGQTPFTPAVGILRQIHSRLIEIHDQDGVKKERQRIAELATYFREQIRDLPFTILPDRMSNALTALRPITAKAFDIFQVLKDEYGIWICPNGGLLRDTVLRVGHIGNLSKADVDRLIDALHDMQNRKLI